MKTRFQERVKKLVEVDAPNLRNTFKNGMLQACDEVCGKKVEKKHGDTWWWNEDMKEAIRQRKVAHKMCEN